jgi:hypothetical protein
MAPAIGHEPTRRGMPGVLVRQRHRSDDAIHSLPWPFMSQTESTALAGFAQRSPWLTALRSAVCDRHGGPRC